MDSNSKRSLDNTISDTVNVEGKDEVPDTTGSIIKRHKEKFYFTTPTHMLARQGTVKWNVPRRPKPKFSEFKVPDMEPVPGFIDNQRKRNPGWKGRKGPSYASKPTVYSGQISYRSADSSLLESVLCAEEEQQQLPDDAKKSKRTWVTSSIEVADAIVLPEVTNFLLLDPKIFEEITDPLAIVHLVRKYPEMGFLYMIPSVSRTSIHFSPYKLRIVGFEKINKNDFFTISLHGVTQYWAREASFTELARWEKEYKFYLQLLTKRTFSKFRMWKTFRTWYKTVRYFIVKQRTENLQNNLYILNPNLRKALLALNRACYKLDLTNMVKIEEGKTSTLANFFTVQVQKMNELRELLNKFRAATKELILIACRTTLLEVGFVPDDCILEYPEMAAFVDKMTYAEQANKRNYCQRLTRFIRLVDYIILTFKFVIVRDSCAYLLSILTMQLERFKRMGLEPAAPIKDHEKMSEVTPAARPVKPEETPPLFKVLLLLVEETLDFDPDAVTFIDTVMSIVSVRQEVMRVMGNLTPDPQFESFTRPMINWKLEEKICGSGPSIAAVFDGDKIFQEIIVGLRKKLTTAFKFAADFSRTLEPIKEFYLLNEKRDLNSLTSSKLEVDFFQQSLVKYTNEQAIVDAMPVTKYLGILLLDLSDLKQLVQPAPGKCLQVVNQMLPIIAKSKMDSVFAAVQEAQMKIDRQPTTTQDYVEYIMFADNFTLKIDDLEATTDMLTKVYELIDQYKIYTPPEDFAMLATLAPTVMMVRMASDKTIEERANNIDKFCNCIEEDIADMNLDLATLNVECENPMLLDPKGDLGQIKETLGQLQQKAAEFAKTANQFSSYQRHFNVEVSEYPLLEMIQSRLSLRLLLWESIDSWDIQFQQWLDSDFHLLDPDLISETTTKFSKIVARIEKHLPPNDLITVLKDKVQEMKELMASIIDLRNPTLKSRHWNQIEKILHVSFADLELSFLRELKGNEEILNALAELSAAATSEFNLERIFRRIEDSWKEMEFVLNPYRDSRDVFILAPTEEIQILLDESLISIMNILSSRYCSPIKSQVETMDIRLKLFAKTLDEWLNVQKNWVYLESIFSSPDIARQLPAEAKMFMQVDKTWKDIMRRTNKMPLALNAATQPGVLEAFQNCSALLEQIMKCLESYLDSKCMVFARFFFLSNEELLEILTQARNPMAIQPHLRKCFDGIVALEFGCEEDNGVVVPTNDVIAMISPEGEKVELAKGLKARGNIEDWMLKVEDATFQAVKRTIVTALIDYEAKMREEWVIAGHPSQTVLVASQIIWANEVEDILSNPNKEEVLDDVLKFEQKGYSDLNKLASLVRGQLTSLNRMLLGALITIDVHARDNITMLVKNKVTTIDDFKWQRQLRYSWNEGIDNCVATMSISSYIYGYEYLGASPRLVITPLTDRCYLCLMGAMQVNLGAAPSGPAGTGKTETTKDLAKALANLCIVFNCSDGMDFKMLGRFFTGICQAGAWACFDEFNRIDLDVLSVVAQQLITIRYAKANNLSRFMFEGREIRLLNTCAVFITMNPGYAGRTELPDNLKALFRPVSMMVPDYTLIAEVVLYSEGFESSRILARKMTQMYKLCSEQLSQQDHYDFGMRAVKSVLVMAGSLKREDPDLNEAVVLLRAMRDSNVPKFIAMDVKLFSAILLDLFPEVTIPEHDYGLLETSIVRATKKKNLQPHPAFVAKVIQFYETMIVRHGVMLVGPPAAGKTQCYEVLRDTFIHLHVQGVKHPQYKPVHVTVMNPKSVSMGELYGEVNQTTLEWNDGLLGYYTRVAVNSPDKDHHWIVCDGPVDAVWIENLNSVLDDNKLFCLANSERIKLTAWIHMIFEVQDLTQASPATVSRCGMVYLDPHETGWGPYVSSWLQKITSPTNEHLLDYVQDLFDNHLDQCLQFSNKYCIQAISQVDISKVSTLCHMMESILFTEVLETGLEYNKVCTLLSQAFIFSLLWGLGGNLIESSAEVFATFVRERFEDHVDAKLPAGVDLWNLYLDFERKRLTMWDRITPSFVSNPTTSFFDTLVPTVDTVRYGYALEKLLAVKMPVLYTGSSGVGKSVIARSQLFNIMETWKYIPVFINFSTQTSSFRLQEIIQSKLEKKRKTIFGAPEGRRVIIFIDDVNMPKPDTYGSQPPIELLRQYLDFTGFYDREKLFWKQVIDVTLSAACALPGGGRNSLPPRFLRHFSIFCIPTPTDVRLKHIFVSILGGFLQTFPQAVKEKTEAVVTAAVEIYTQMSTDLLPTPDKSHYLFSLRDLSKCFQGILQVSAYGLRNGNALFRLFCHEAQRVFHDRLINVEDKMYFHELMSELASTLWQFPIEPEHFITDPIIFGDFIRMGTARSERTYEQISSMITLKKVLQDYLFDYNSGNSKEMKLVFFLDAILHIVRLMRILRLDRGNALLVGVGGTGKQSLTRLSSHMNECKCYQIELKRNYDYTAFQEDLKIMYFEAGLKKVPVVFLFTDTQILTENFLEDINSILNSGDIPNLFAADEFENILAETRPLAMKAGINETDREAVYSYFIKDVRYNLHVVLCMSPVGEAFRTRCRIFPALINCCTIDWYLEWPHDALLDVANFLFAGIDFGDEEGNVVREKVPHLCVEIHQSVSLMAERFYSELRRRYYTTPTSYLELISVFSSILRNKREVLTLGCEKIEKGLGKLRQSNAVVGEMQVELTAVEPILKESSDATEELLIKLVEEQEEKEKVKQVVQEDEAMAKVKAEETQQFVDDAQKDLMAALPAFEDAIDALGTLDKSDIAEVRVFTSPPELVETVMEAVCILLDSNPNWTTAKLLLGDVGFLRRLVELDKDHIPIETTKKLKPYIKNPNFVPDIVGKTSKACKSIVMWVRAIYNYAKLYRRILPKRKKVEVSKKELETVLKLLSDKQERLALVEAEISRLQKLYSSSLEEKEKLIVSMAQISERLKRASKLTSGLINEQSRWTITVLRFQDEINHIVGDVFVSTACIAYYGAFTTAFRTDLVEQWVEAVTKFELPISSAYSLISVMADPFQIRQWNVDGLPKDNLSTENAILVVNGRRCPLMIDPQDQANRWIRNMESRNRIHLLKLSDKSFVRTLEICIEYGTPVLLEDIGETLEPLLEPILLKQTFKKLGKLYMKLGDVVVEYNPQFRFYITTKMANPHYLPEVCIKVTIINFAVTVKGLEDQLLSAVVQIERPDLEQLRQKLIIGINEDKAQLVKIEDSILRLLYVAEGNILDNKELLKTLDESKTTSTEIQTRLLQAETTEAMITQAREKYRPVAARASVLYFVLTMLPDIDPMYQNSLKFFSQLFNNTIDTTEKTDNLQQRLQSLTHHITLATYNNVARGLFEQHKLIFSTMICADVMIYSNKMPREEWNYFLRGFPSLDSKLPQKPQVHWLTDTLWMACNQLETYIPNFQNLCEELITTPINIHLGSLKLYINPRKWDGYKIKDGPKNAWEHRLTDIQKLILIKTFHEEKVVLALTEFVVTYLGRPYVESPQADLQTLYADTRPNTPLIFILVQGSDATGPFMRFAKEKGVQERVHGISLGQGQGPIAEKLIADSIKSGDWVFLQNCHVLPSWMMKLEGLIKDVIEIPDIANEDYRLFISSMPTAAFPVSALQNSVKATIEPPKGLRTNVKRAFAEIPTSFFEDHSLQLTWRKIVFGLVFFHAIIQERKKFGPLGWNIKYEFNDSDRDHAFTTLGLFCIDDEISWEALDYITSSITYGGRVTDAWDQRTLETILKTFFGPNTLDQTYKYSPSAIYYAPEYEKLEEYQLYIEGLPLIDDPEIFGMHDNANIVFQIQETQTLLKILLSLQPRLTGVGAGKSPDEIVNDLVGLILYTLPSELDVDDILLELLKLDNKGRQRPTTVVLFQEIAKFNRLTENVKMIVTNLHGAVNGTVAMTDQLEKIFNSLLSNEIPAYFAKYSYPSLKSFGSWFRDLILRLQFIKDWLTMGEPRSYWLSGFFYPQGLLTAVLQTHARKYNLPIDELDFSFEIIPAILMQTDFDSSAEAAVRQSAISFMKLLLIPDDGILIHGLFLDAARFDIKRMRLQDPLPREINSPFPIVHLTPTIGYVPDPKEYACPLYKTSIRFGTLSTTGHSSNFVMSVQIPTKHSPDYWIVKGTALLCQVTD